MERTGNRSSAVTIYWQTRNREAIKAIVDRFNLPCYMSVNRETRCRIGDDDMPLLVKCEEKGLIKLRNKQES
mgnify:FL=1